MREPRRACVPGTFAAPDSLRAVVAILRIALSVAALAAFLAVIVVIARTRAPARLLLADPIATILSLGTGVDAVTVDTTLA